MPNIEQFKGAFNNLARTNRFRLRGFLLPNTIEVLGKGATLPATTIGVIDVNYQGRIIKMDGDRNYEDFSMTIYNDERMGLRREFERWSNNYNDPIANVGGPDKRDGYIELLGRADEVLIEFQIVGAVCTSVGNADLDWGTNDTALEIPITLSYDYHIVTR